MTNFREKFLAKYLNKIGEKRAILTEKEREFFDTVKNAYEKGKYITPHQFNWLKDIYESLR
jgi:hypothetical protein